MKNKLLTSVLLLSSFGLFAQVQIDKDIQLNGTAGNRDITGAQTIDVSVGYLFGNSPGSSGQVLRSNGSTGFVAASIIASDLPDLSGSYIKNQTTPQTGANFNIDGNGRVGGVMNAISKYQLDGVDAIYNSGTDIYGNIRVLQSNSTFNDGMYINYNSTGATAADLRFFANGANERMRILATNGNVGIGLPNPSYTLDVNGTAQVNYLTVKPQGGSSEGGEIQLQGAGSFATFQFDNESGNARIHTLAAGKRFQVVGGGIQCDEQSFLYSGGSTDLTSNVVLRKDGTTAYLFPWSTGFTNRLVSIGGNAETDLSVDGAIVNRTAEALLGSNLTVSGITPLAVLSITYLHKGGNIFVSVSVPYNTGTSSNNRTFARIRNTTTNTIIIEGSRWMGNNLGDIINLQALDTAPSNRVNNTYVLEMWKENAGTSPQVSVQGNGSNLTQITIIEM